MTSSNYTLYTKQNYSDFLRKYPEQRNTLEISLLEVGSRRYVSNVSTDMVAVALEGSFWPVSLNKTEYENALICSPYTTYVTYPLHMIDKMQANWVRQLMRTSSFLLNYVFKLTRINKVAQVNNTLNSVLKHPQKLSPSVSTLTDYLIHCFRQHAILLFRVNEKLDAALLESLKSKGYIVFPDRVVHLFDPANKFMKRSNVKRDLALRRKSSYQVVRHEEFSSEDVKRVSELYHSLFVDKHSQHNPQYTSDFFAHAIQNKWHEYVGLRHPNGKIDAFISWSYKENFMICGPIGYDTGLALKEGLYRQIVLLALQHAEQHQLIFNMGAGSDLFKQRRGSQRVLEFTAVYCKHLPFYRSIPWRLLRVACKTVLPKIFATESF